MSPVIIGFRIDFLAETGTKYTITAWSTVFSFPPFFLFSSFLLLMLPCISLCFLSPPRGPYAGIFLSFVLLRPCSSYMSLIGSVCFPYIIPGTSINSTLIYFIASCVPGILFHFTIINSSYFLIFLVVLRSLLPGTLPFHLLDP